MDFSDRVSVEELTKFSQSILLKICRIYLLIIDRFPLMGIESVVSLFDSALVILRDAQEQVPALKYTTGIVGIAAAIFLISALTEKLNNLLFFWINFFGMILLFVFSVAETGGVIGGNYAASLLIWSVNLLVIASLFGNYPRAR